MSELQLVAHPGFRKDYLAALSWLETHLSEQIVIRFQHELQTGFRLIRENPKGFHFDLTGRRRYNFNNLPYAVIYQEFETEIVLLTLRHDSQSPNHGRRRKAF